MNNSPAQEFELNVKYYLRENDKFIAQLRLIDGHLKPDFSKNITDEEKSELETYFDDNISEWEKFEYAVPFGKASFNDEGKVTSITDGQEKLDINSDPMFLLQLHVRILNKDKKTKFNMKYIVSMEKTFGLCLSQ